MLLSNVLLPLQYCTQGITYYAIFCSNIPDPISHVIHESRLRKLRVVVIFDNFREYSGVGA